MSEYTDNLIAEARAGGGPAGQTWGDYYRPGMTDYEARAYKAGFAAALETHRAALDAVQPVTPDRELVVKAIRDGFKAIRGGNSLSWSVDPEALADALLASGVLGQPSSDVQTGSKFEVPQPQPTKAQLIEAIEGAWTDDDPEFSSVIADALLPLLGQPRPPSQTPGPPRMNGSTAIASGNVPDPSSPLPDRDVLIRAVITAGIDWEGNNTSTWDRGASVVDALLPLLGQPCVPEDPQEFEDEIQVERSRQRTKGYDAAHDREHGEKHLLAWAEDYIRRGKVIEGVAMIRAVRELRGDVKAQVFEYPPGYNQIRAGRAE